MPWTENRRIIDKILNPSPTVQLNSQLSKVLSMIPEGSKVLDLGAGGRKITPDTITIDFINTDNTSILADLHSIPLKDESIECIFCTGTLEHVEYPENVLKETVRVLKKDGIVYIDVPFMQCYHPDPEDYWRFTIKGLELICVRNGFAKIETGVNIGPASALTWILMAFSQTIFGNGGLRKIFGTFFSILFLPIKYLDKLIIKRENYMVAASAVYFIGRRK